MMLPVIVLSLILLLSAVGVMAFRDPISSALCLIANLLTVAVLFALLEAHFLAAVQVIVYAGAIMVLFVFVIMLLNVKVEAVKRKGVLLATVACLTGGAFLAVFVRLCSRAFGGFEASADPVVGTVKNIGLLLYTKYLFPFEAASLLIVAAIVGAVMIAKRRHSDTALKPR